jgi:hypothetical protein
LPISTTTASGPGRGLLERDRGRREPREEARIPREGRAGGMACDRRATARTEPRDAFQLGNVGLLDGGAGCHGRHFSKDRKFSQICKSTVHHPRAGSRIFSYSSSIAPGLPFVISTLMRHQQTRNLPR